MFKRSKPADDIFFKLIAQSSEYLLKAAKLLVAICEADPVARPPLRNQLHDIEHEADKCTHQVATKLNQTFVTPLDRDDIQLLSGSLDDCVDYVDEAADMIVLYDLQDIPHRLTQQVDILLECAKITAKYMPRVGELHGLREYWVEINRLENDGDRIHRKLLSELFKSANDPILLIKVKDITERLERGIDAFERLATVIETIAIKES
ncbi:MAG: DUF47 family protein [Actinomycetaceae bacterium]|nr:DUF47 family protein [Actinomycetaceae bacterium]